jgi:oxygen-dependent protoporphyrinogen oxidase
MAGIYAADGDELSLLATFPRLQAAEREHGGVIRGVLAARNSAPAAATRERSPFLAPIGGLADLVAALEFRLRAAGVEIRTGTEATSIAAAASGYDVRLETGECFRADAVILALPAFVAAELLSPIQPALATELLDIPYASTAIVTFGYRAAEIPHALDGHGYVVPRREGSAILACTWSSRKWAHRAPSGWELIRVFVGRSGRDDTVSMDDADLIGLARQEARARLGIEARPSLTRVSRWPRGMPQYILGHPQRLARIQRHLSSLPGVHLAGNAYHGVGIPDCIASGEQAARAAAELLAMSTPAAGLVFGTVKR